MNPKKISDLVKLNIRLIRGSVPGGSVSLTALIYTFATTPAFTGRTKIYSGGVDDILAAIVADGFAVTSDVYLGAAGFLSVEVPESRVMIARRDAGDATWTETMTAIAAEDDSFALVVAKVYTKIEVLQISAWCESRWKHYLTLSSEAGAKTKTAGTLVADLFALKRKKTTIVWYDAAEATSYGPAVIDSEPGPFNLLGGQTLILTTYDGSVYDGYERTLSFLAAAATVVSSGFTTGLADGETVIMEIDDLDPITITFEDLATYFPGTLALATASQVVAYLNDFAPQVTWSVDTGELRATSQRQGSGSKVEFTGGTALSTLGFSVGSTAGTGSFVFADDAQASEAATRINTLAAGTSQVTVGTMAFNGTDAVGLVVDGGAPVFVPSNTSNAQTLTDLKVEWDSDSANTDLATMTVNATTVTLTFLDKFTHTVSSHSPATADITGIANTTSATTPLALSASAVGTRLRLTSSGSGESVRIAILGGTALDAFGFEAGDYFGNGVTYNYFDAVFAGQVAHLAGRLDLPGGSVPHDNMKLPLLGNTLDATSRENLRAQNCNTYEVRTANYPGELHWGVNTAGFNSDFAVWALWLELRLAEAVKNFQDRKTAQRQRVPYDDSGIAQVDAVLQGPFVTSNASGAISFDPAPFDPLTKETGWYKPTIAQSANNKAAQKVSGWRTVQLDAGAIKAVEIDIDLSSQ
jgi:hypothetical protein